MNTRHHFELLSCHFELLKTPREENHLRTAVIHVDPLIRTTDVVINPLSSIRSRMGREIALLSGNAVCRVPGVQQPSGRMCGVAICINLLLFTKLSLAQYWTLVLMICSKTYHLPEKESGSRGRRESLLYPD